MTAPELLREVDRADVYLGDARAAMLERDARDHITFRYRNDFLAEHALAPLRARSIAWTLLATPTFTAVETAGGSVPPFFAGLLPEGVRLDAAVASTKTSIDDHFTLLVAVGSDTIGNVRVTPADVAPGAADPAIDPRRPTDFAAVAAAVGESLDADPIALSGVQPKVSASRLTAAVRAPDGPAILKFSPPRFPRLAENENFFLRMAKACGLRTPRHELVVDDSDRTALLVQRFDRDASGRRIAQEDACQVAGVYPAGKYRMKTETAISVLAAACADGGGSAPAATLELMQTVAFSWLVGNGDLHGKNLSVYCPDDFWQPTPSYDLISTQPYLQWRDPMAMNLYGRNNRLTRQHFVESGEHLGLRPKATTRMLDRLVAASEPWVDRCDEIGYDEKTTARLRTLLDSRRDSLR
ncbi:type II toxin-antitoxin system HipA family toxin [Gordonia sp. X0973]|uniref:type II toxin-antitoxin system HipA family toxin n=1 Tax=Gordonia sp. X0973 TaxID=2742602 RepID=UPI000F53466B|nr:type II toxin-antitoxin system HipA family toxin [Gordonia sp. X0973]QKT06760.1 type II toxin-antitoxin system HipA family toxin [Gordonia sp. X0973]